MRIDTLKFLEFNVDVRVYDANLGKKLDSFDVQKIELTRQLSPVNIKLKEEFIMKKFVSGFMCGTLLFSTISFASNIVAVLSPQNIVLNGNKANITAYNINGNNYFKLVDIAKAANFNVQYDVATNTVNIDTEKEYSDEIFTDKAQENSTLSKIPKDQECFVPEEKMTVNLDDGTTYTFTDMSKYDKSMFASGPVGDLPTPTCDWSEFPELKIPQLEVRHFNNENGDYLFVSNVKEMKRMQYTLYNAIGNNSEVWENGTLKRSSKGNPLVRIKFGIESDVGVQSFYPYYEERLIKVFESCPIGIYALEAWDVYKNGKFLYTEYKFQID